jgi:hypothetical protein
LKEQKEEEAISLYLHAELTQKEVADKVGYDQSIISDLIKKNMENCKNAEFHKSLNFTPFLYNIWNTPSENNSIKHFGLFPEVFFENLPDFHI